MRFLLPSLLIGCSSLEAGLVSDTAADAGGGTTIPDVIDTASDTAAAEVTAWWTLSGQLVLRDNAPVPEESQFTVTLLSDTLSVQCAESLPLSDFIAAKSTPDEALIYTWWLVSLGEGDGKCSGASLSGANDPFYIGIGAMNPHILPGLEGDKGIADPSALNATYASFDEGGSVLVFGAAGLAETWASGGEPATAAPLTDGTWRLEPIYTFEYTK